MAGLNDAAAQNHALSHTKVPQNFQERLHQQDPEHMQVAVTSAQAQAMHALVPSSAEAETAALPLCMAEAEMLALRVDVLGCMCMAEGAQYWSLRQSLHSSRGIKGAVRFRWLVMCTICSSRG